MEENNKEKKEQEKEITKPIEMKIISQPKPLTERVQELESKLQEPDKVRKFRMPRRGKVSRRQSRRAYISICRIDDNKNVDFEKRQIIGSTYRLKDGTYHALEDKDVYSYKGKPMVFQPTKKLNPYNFLDGENETYDQEYVQARMLGDQIKLVNKKKAGAFLWIILGIIIIGAVYFIIKNKHVAGV